VNNIISSTFNLSSSPSFAANNTVIFTILTDDYANETSWQVTNSSGAIVAAGARGSLPSNNTTYNRVINISPGECYEFTINDAASDGICCGFGLGSYSLSTDTGLQIVSGGNFGASEVTPFNIDSTAGLEDLLQDAVAIFPNPSTGLFNVTSSLDEVKYEIYSLNGKLITSGNLSNGNSQINLNAVADGLYLMKLSSNNTQITKKLIKK
jgi:hypothetical protein